MEVAGYDYLWRVLKEDGVGTGTKQFEVGQLLGRTQCVAALNEMNHLRGNDRLLVVHQIAGFPDFAKAATRIGRRDEDADPTFWTRDHFASNVLIETRAQSVEMPRHQLTEDWNPSFYFRLKQLPSMNFFEACEMEPVLDQFNSRLANGQLVVWDDVVQMLVIFKQQNRFRGWTVRRSRGTVSQH